MFDFNSGNVITNPLDGVTHFYVSPYEVPEVWTLLNIGSKVTDLDVDLVIQTHTNLPVIVMPLSILQLGRCIIKLNDDMGGGKICTGKKSLYFRFTEQNTICITGVH
jgi:hypothetical protein